MINYFFFFFQAEDGIRDYKVTGVQTCALPILTFAPPIGRIAPVAMIEPWPFMRRGTEATVPMVPGFVRVIVAPAKSSGTSLLVRAVSTSVSYVAWNVAKSMPSACLMTGTTRA